MRNECANIRLAGPKSISLRVMVVSVSLAPSCCSFSVCFEIFLVTHNKKPATHPSSYCVHNTGGFR